MNNKKWIISKLKDIGKIVSGGTPSTANSQYWGNEIAWITPADLSGYSNKYISKGRKSISKDGLENSSAKLVPKNSVLFSSRAPIGYVVIASNDLATNQGFKNIVPNSNIDSLYLYYYLKASKKLAEEQASGTTFKEISGSKFGELPIPVPPLEHQQLIVSKLEELFSKLDKGVESLKTLQQQLKVYRQAVLKWAFEGRLTNDNVKDGELPEGWRQVIFQDLILKIRSGTAAVPTNERTDFPILRSSSVRTGAINFGDVKYIAASTSIKGDDLLSAGDLLFTRLNGSVDYVGNCAKVPNTFPKNLIYPDRLFRVKLKEENLADYIVYFFASPLYRRTIEKKAKSTAGHMRISTPDITTMLVPICSQHEQKKIVQEIESRLSVCDKIEETITTGLKEAEALRQSILKKAFEGKLV